MRRRNWSDFVGAVALHSHNITILGMLKSLRARISTWSSARPGSPLLREPATTRTDLMARRPQSQWSFGKGRRDVSEWRKHTGFQFHSSTQCGPAHTGEHTLPQRYQSPFYCHETRGRNNIRALLQLPADFDGMNIFHWDLLACSGVCSLGEKTTRVILHRTSSRAYVILNPKFDPLV